MGLFGGKKQPDQPSGGPAAGRRRPLPSEAERRPQAFSYYSQRSGARDLERTPVDGRDTARSRDISRGGMSGLARGSTSDDGAVRRFLTNLWHNRLVVTAGLVVAIGLLGFMVALDVSPKIVAQTRDGNAYFLQDTRLYQQTASETLSSSLLNRSKLTLDRDSVATDLKKHYPEIDEATVTAPLIGRQPIVAIRPNRPTFILTTTTSAAYLLDDNGRALVSTSQITDPGMLRVPTIKDNSGSKVTLGDQALSHNVISFVEAFRAYLEAAGVEYGDIVLPPAAGELHVYIKGTPYFVKANLQGDARLQAGTFLAAQGRLQKDKVTPSQYVDVRVPERAYYK